jgi:nucleoside-diphosphate-sugar epimerase
VVRGDLLDPNSLGQFVEPGSTVINLSYLWNAGEAVNLEVTANLLEACLAGGAKRLIHCSTAAVVGRSPEDYITELTPCRPVTEYGTTKLKIEGAITTFAQGRFDTVILRPTSVFGPGGDPLKKLANDLVSGHGALNYLKSCLFDRRRMNLVHVADVVEAILFMVRRVEALAGGIFIVSDDEAPDNHFAAVERAMRRSFGLGDYPIPRLPLPDLFIRTLLACRGRNTINPRSVFVPAKLLALGFVLPIRFEDALSEYISWYATTYLGKANGVTL